MKEVYRVYHVESGNALFSNWEEAFEYAKQCLIKEYNNDYYNYFSDLNISDCIDELERTGEIDEIVYIYKYNLDSCREF